MTTTIKRDARFRRTDMRKYTVATEGRATPNQAMYEVHAAGCADIQRGMRSHKYGSTHNTKAGTPEEVVAKWVAEFTESEMGWTEDDFRIMPCCKNAPDA